MHKLKLTPEFKARLRAWRDTDHPFEALNPARTAHVVIDLQNGFMAPGQLVELASAREIVPNVNKISAAVRAAGGINIFIRWTIVEQDFKTWSTWYRKFANEARAKAMFDTFKPGSEGHALWAGLDIQPQDLIVNKSRFSAFIPGTSELHDVLQSHNIDTLIITGTATNVCCESAARDAMQMNYEVIFVADATAAATDLEHNSTLDNLVMFADIVSTDEIVSFLAASKRSKEAAD